MKNTITTKPGNDGVTEITATANNGDIYTLFRDTNNHESVASGVRKAQRWLESKNQ